MDPRSHDLLELPAVLRRLSGHTAFDGGRDLALTLEPSPDPDVVAHRQAETAEALELARLGISPPAGAHDVRHATAAAARGATLEVTHLEDVLHTVEAALEVRASLVAHADDAPIMAGHGAAIDALALRELEGPLARALDRRGGVLDTASAELARLRREVARTRERAAQLLRELAQRLKSHLQEGFITERGGRPVLAVKASSRSAVPGIVHDGSGSGQTIFVEPMALVEENNRLREAEAAEREEVARVLAALSAAVGERAAALDRAVQALADTDLALARAALSRAWDGCEPATSDEVVLQGARHPLLDPATAVPVDLPLRDLRAVVVTGPNTGGKTVSLKTLGLLALLVQCGLRPPARVARLPVFDAVLADIGDEQSIEMSLSTFSGHLRSLNAIIDRAGPRSLVLLDEIAAGTDPEEGGPLAIAILERLVGGGARVMATSHLAALREWASGTDGVANAAVGFDAASLAPTYEVRLGEPGASHALAVAERLGLPADVLAAARGRLTPERRAVEDLLLEADAARAQARRVLEEAEGERDRARRAANAAERREKDLERRIAQVRARADEERAHARREAERELASLTADLRALRAEIREARRLESERGVAPADAPGADAGRRRDRSLGAADRAAERAAAGLARAAAPAPPARPVEVGDAVVDTVLGLAGTVIAIQGDRADVQGPLARVSVPLARLAHDTRPTARSAPRQVEAVRIDVTLPQDASSPEIDVRGQRAAAACAAVRERIDAAAMAGRDSIRVVHGHGTGALRAAIREELARHPLVARAVSAPPEEGGDGATLVHLADRG